MDSTNVGFYIAPCGMNCTLCMAYLRVKNKCSCCRSSNEGKSISILRCKIRNCEKLNSEFCYTCQEYPCKNVKHIDKRYRTKYNMSMIQNLEYIRDKGISAFITSQKAKWTCPKCGGTICVHKGYCISCGNKEK